VEAAIVVVTIYVVAMGTSDAYIMLKYLQNQSRLNIHDARKWQMIICERGRPDSPFCIFP
jgi:hypothetical protein